MRIVRPRQPIYSATVSAVPAVTGPPVGALTGRHPSSHDARMDNLRPGRAITVAGYDLFVRELGAEGPLVPPRLLVHNALSSSKIWSRVLPLLAHHTRCVAPDLPGHGDSADLAAGAPAPDMPQVLAALATECGMPTFDLIGASRGGGFALDLAARFPQRVRRLVLVGATGMPARLVPSGTLRARYDELVYDRVLMNEVRTSFAADGARAVEYERRRAHALTAEQRRDGMEPSLSQVTAPTLLIWGEHDKHVPLAWGELLRDRLPDARLEIMRGVSHLPHYEAPEAFAALVNEFLAS